MGSFYTKNSLISERGRNVQSELGFEVAKCKHLPPTSVHRETGESMARTVTQGSVHGLWKLTGLVSRSTVNSTLGPAQPCFLPDLHWDLSELGDNSPVAAPRSHAKAPARRLGCTCRSAAAVTPTGGRWRSGGASELKAQSSRHLGGAAATPRFPRRQGHLASRAGPHRGRGSTESPKVWGQDTHRTTVTALTSRQTSPTPQ